MIETKNNQTDPFLEEETFNGKSKDEYEKLVEIYNSVPMEMPRENDVVEGEYVGFQSDQHIFRVKSFKDDIRIDDKQSENIYIDELEIGDTINLIITGINNSNFEIYGSISKLYEKMAHKNLKKSDNTEPVEAYIKNTNPAGYDVEILYDNVSLNGFMPNTLAGVNKLYDPESIVGESFNVMIESYSDSEKTYIVSRKKYLKTLIPEEVEKLEYGRVYNGRVTGTTKYGVFVEFNKCLTGMIHKVNINEKWREHLDKIEPGFEIDFYIKEIINKKNSNIPKIILTQILRESIWDNIEIGDELEATVKDIKPFGVLVVLDEETNGLIHKNEMDKFNKKLNVGDDVKVKVLNTDRESRKVFLTYSK